MDNLVHCGGTARCFRGKWTADGLVDSRRHDEIGARGRLRL